MSEELLDRLRRQKVSPEEQAELEAKCQENDWLCYGGCAWVDDPFLEEYPYDFCRTESLEDLRLYLEHGNWAIRQGILYHDLAFIQQDNGGDEWWTLKRLDDGQWMSFESWTFGSVAKSRSDFSRVIASMEMATPAECKLLVYGLPESNLFWESACVDSNECASAHQPAFKGENETHLVSVIEEKNGFSVEVESKTDEGMCSKTDGFLHPLEAAIFGCAQIGFVLPKHGIETGARKELLDERASRLRAAANHSVRIGREQVQRSEVAFATKQR